MPRVRARRRRRKLTYAATGVLILMGVTMVFRFHPSWLVPAVVPARQSPPAGDLAALIGGNSQLKADEANLLAAVNQARRESGAGPLQLSTRLEQIAREHSYDMSASYHFSQQGSDGMNAEQRLRAAGIDYSPSGENIYRAPNFDSAELAKRAVQGWLASPQYRKNLLSPDFTRTGIGVARGNGTIYVTEDFVKE